MTDGRRKVLLSTVTPVYMGAKYLRPLVAELETLRSDLEREDAPLQLVESIFVDDGSVDDSAAVLEELQADRPWVRVITLSRNFGQHPATVAGILHSCGDWVATLDEDLQHRPRHLVPLLRHAVLENRDVAFAAPLTAVHGATHRDFFSRTYKRLLGVLTRNPHIPLFNSFRMMRGTLARSAAALCGYDTFFDLSLCWVTTRIGALPLPLADERFSADRRSGYSFLKLLRHARRLFVTAQLRIRPLAAAILLGTLLASIVLMVRIVVARVYHPQDITEPGWASLVVTVMFYGGFELLLLGLIVEYLSVILNQAMGRPTFLVVDRSLDRELRAWLIEKGPA